MEMVYNKDSKIILQTQNGYQSNFKNLIKSLEEKCGHERAVLGLYTVLGISYSHHLAQKKIEKNYIWKKILFWKKNYILENFLILEKIYFDNLITWQFSCHVNNLRGMGIFIGTKVPSLGAPK